MSLPEDIININFKLHYSIILINCDSSLGFIFPNKFRSMSFVRMAHMLHNRQKFDDFSLFKSAIEQSQNAELVQFFKGTSRTIAAAQLGVS